MSLSMRPSYLAQGERRIFALLHPCERPRAALLMAPPFMHEHTLSYRLFALLGDELSKQKIAVLRPHYTGMGDSDGDEREFSLGSACADAFTAAAALREHAPGVPMHVLGVRAGALVAADLAERTDLSGLWFWQPVVDGRDYLRHLRALDAAERDAIARFPAPAPTDSGEDRPDALVGFSCSERLLGELESARLQATSKWPHAHVLDVNETALPFPIVQRIGLPPALGAWADRIYMDHIPLAAIRDVAARLSAAMEIA